MFLRFSSVLNQYMADLVYFSVFCVPDPLGFVTFGFPDQAPLKEKKYRSAPDPTYALA
jgi:hypothetical protein